MSNSMYAQYITERSQDKIIELPQGFATYRYLNEKQVYLIDLFVLPDHRKSHIASEMANMVCAEAKVKGCTEMLGTVCPSANGSTDSLKVLLAYGMTLKSASTDIIVFSKELV